VNSDLAEYLVPTNADIPPINAFFIEEEDPHVNRIGTKGMGEIGNVGAAAAIAN
jgi:xanthine dehydrogenase YagR molybdenum-binding subunit